MSINLLGKFVDSHNFVPKCVNGPIIFAYILFVLYIVPHIQKSWL